MIAGLCSDCRRGVHTHADTCGSQLDRPLSTCVCIVCPICNSTDVSVARNMKSTRHCDHCGHEWDPTPKPDGRLVPNAIAAVKIADVLDSLERRILERLGAGLGQWPIIEACNVVHDEFLRTRAAVAPMPVEMPPKQKNATVGPSSSICGAPTPRGPCTRPPGHFDLHIGANEPDAPPRPSHGDDMRALRIGPVPNTMAEVFDRARNILHGTGFEPMRWPSRDLAVLVLAYEDLTKVHNQLVEMVHALNKRVSDLDDPLRDRARDA